MAITSANQLELLQTAEAVAREVRLTLGSMDDLAPIWSRAIATLLSSGSGG